MRILTLPATLALSFLLYFCVPNAANAYLRGLSALYARARALLRKNGRIGERLAFVLFLLVLFVVSALLSALHPAVGTLLTVPVFTALSLVPQGAAIKQELDSGVFAGDIPAYESRVRAACASFAPSFVCDAFAPLLLTALGTPLYIGPSLGLVYSALRAVGSEDAKRTVAVLLRPADALMCAILFLCSGLVGRNPFRAGGKGADQKLMHILGIAGDESDTHAPVSGDISQCALLCCFSLSLLCFLLTLILFPLTV